MVDILTRSLAETDPEVHSAVAAELGRQQATLEMIASENFAPVAVMEGVSSGLRIGTPALATRGFGDDDFREVADTIAAALKPDFDDQVAEKLRERVSELAAKYPLYLELGDSNGGQ